MTEQNSRFDCGRSDIRDQPAAFRVDNVENLNYPDGKFFGWNSMDYTPVPSKYVSNQKLSRYRNALKHMLPVRRKNESKKVLAIDDAGLFSLITFSWLSKYIYKAYKKGLTKNDIPKCSPLDSCDLNAQRLESIWERELTEQGPAKASFGRAIWRFVRTRVLINSVTFSISCIMGFLSPTIFMRKLLEYLEEEDKNYTTGLIWAVALTCTEVLRTVFFALYYSMSYRTALRLRCACLAMVYRKVLRLSSARNTSAGVIINLYGFDGPRLYYMIVFGPMALGGPIISVCAFFTIYYILGPWALLGMLTFILYYPLQYLLAYLTGHFRQKAIKLSDKRIKFVTEILTSIKLIKMYAWENWFASQVQNVRNNELDEIKKIAYCQSVGISLAPTIPVISAIATFLVHVTTGGNLTAAQDVLMLEENTTRIQPHPDKSVALSVKNGCFCWDVAVLEPEHLKQKRAKRGTEVFLEDDQVSLQVLHSVNIAVPKGALIGICGPIGAGKSSLLLACLGQLKMISGEIWRTGTCAYVSQQSWMQNTSLRENILFGEKFDPKKYAKVLDACVLNDDLNFLPGGDETEIGERGVNLSGGQKQRIALARALYSDRDIYFLDDPLSAVDPSVGIEIFDKCIMDALKDKTVLFVTSQIQFLRKCDEILVLKQGQIVETDNFDNLVNEGNEFGFVLQPGPLNSSQKEEVFNRTKMEVKNSEKSDGQRQQESKTTGTKLTREEVQIRGTIKSTAYRAYIEAAGGYLVCMCVTFIILLSVGSNVFSSWWLAMWIKEGSGNTTIYDPVTNSTVISRNISDNPRLSFYMTVYASLIGFIVVTCIIRGFAYTRVTMRASKEIHQNLFQKILESPMRYFERTPIGQIQNLFARDMDEIDSRLPESVETMLQNIWAVMFSFLSITLVFHWFLIPMLVLACLYYFISRIFRVAIRDLKRMESISRSPVFSTISATVQGLSVIHAFRKEQDYINHFTKLFNENSTIFFMSTNAMRWMAVRLDFISLVIIFITSLLVALLKGEVAPAFAGLALTYAAQICGVFQYTIRLLSENEARFISVERIQDNIEARKLVPEGNVVTELKVPDNWPSKGGIKFEEVKLSYGGDLPDVLNDISISINGGEKIGVVGRTGAGKSSLVAALFRLVELSSGKIYIDGVNIAAVSLSVLRSRLSVIPQDPTLFSESLRSNLDPFNKCDDDFLWDVLKKTRLLAKVKSMPNQMSTYVGDGENLSVGEKQLVCLARTLARGSKILILDEATASIDPETEMAVQTTIRNEFRHCTVITIAHRLSTVTNCDRILVIEQGTVLEFDSPQVLLSSPNSRFSKMVEASEFQ
ncbi:hypothetical protein RUM43_003497 [Polyplax serrata]|uniref:Uncharacterized protein n=1 Tax=Polyplax serrata TaxID=468196 RepID=A0AAN8S6I4_POLSC